MRSREILNDLNKLIDKVSDDIEETKKQKTMDGFIYHSRVLEELKYAIGLAKKYMSDYIESKNESVP